MDGKQEDDTTVETVTETVVQQLDETTVALDTITVQTVQAIHHNGDTVPTTLSASSVLLSAPPRTPSPSPPSPRQYLSPALIPSRSQLPLSPSFLHSLAALPPLSPSASASSPTPADIAVDPAAAADSAYLPCPCQNDVGQPTTLTTPRKRQLTASASSPAISTNNTTPSLAQPASPERTSSHSNTASPPSIPATIAAILESISSAQAAGNSGHSPSSSFSSHSIEQIVEYLESLCCHLSHTHITLYRYIQHARHAQLIHRDDRLLTLLHAKNAGILERLKQITTDEQQLKQRLADNTQLITTGRKTQALSLSSLPSFMQTEKRRTDAINTARQQTKTDETRVQLLASEKVRLQQQLLVLGGVVTQLGGGKGGDGKVLYEAVEEALRSESMRALLTEEEVEDGCKRMRGMKEWSGQEHIAELKMNQVARMELEMRSRLDELIILYWK